MQRRENNEKKAQNLLLRSWNNWKLISQFQAIVSKLDLDFPREKVTGKDLVSNVQRPYNILMSSKMASSFYTCNAIFSWANVTSSTRKNVYENRIWIARVVVVNCDEQKPLGRFQDETEREKTRSYFAHLSSMHLVEVEQHRKCFFFLFLLKFLRNVDSIAPGIYQNAKDARLSKSWNQWNAPLNDCTLVLLVTLS